MVEGQRDWSPRAPYPSLCPGESGSWFSVLDTSCGLTAMLDRSFKAIARNWWPVAMWLVILCVESTEYASARHTFVLLYKTCTLFGRINPQLLLVINAVLRKGGHFTGYAIFSGLVFVACRRSQLDRSASVQQRRGSILQEPWRLDWALVAVLFTLITASLDEIHQTFLPSRSGRWQDVALDTSGALLMQLLFYAWTAQKISRKRPIWREEPEPLLVGEPGFRS